MKLASRIAATFIILAPLSFPSIATAVPRYRADGHPAEPNKERDMRWSPLSCSVMATLALLLLTANGYAAVTPARKCSVDKVKAAMKLLPQQANRVKLTQPKKGQVTV